MPHLTLRRCVGGRSASLAGLTRWFRPMFRVGFSGEFPVHYQVRSRGQVRYVAATLCGGRGHALRRSASVRLGTCTVMHSLPGSLVTLYGGHGRRKK